MMFDVTADDTEFRHRARHWLRDHRPAGKAPHDGPEARRYALEWLRRQHDAGWSGIAWPSAYGGQGFSNERLMIWHEEYACSGAPSPLDPTFVSLNHAGPTLIACGSDAQKAFHLPRILRGDVIWCQGFSEPGSGSDLASLRATGRIEGDEIVINGQKIWTSYADIADYQELLIRSEPGCRRHQGLSWVICDMRAPGITVRPIENMAGSSHYAEVFYDDVRLPLSGVVGTPGDGWNVAMQTLAFERKTAAMALQLELSARVERLLSDARVGSARPTLLHDIAEARAEAAALRALTYRSLFATETSKFDGSLVRLCFAELSQKIHRIAVQMLGPAGAEAEQPGGWIYAYLESFSETIAGGTSEIQRNIIGERILGLPRGAR